MGMTIEERFKILQDEYTHLMGKYQMMQADYNARLKADIVAMLDKISAEIAEYGSIWVEYKITGNSNRDIEKLVGDVLSQAKKQVLDVIDKYKAESEG